MFGQSRVEVSTSLSNVGGLAVGAFDLINRSLSVVRFVPVFNVGQ